MVASLLRSKAATAAWSGLDWYVRPGTEAVPALTVEHDQEVPLLWSQRSRGLVRWAPLPDVQFS